MRNSITFVIALLLTVSQALSQNTLLWLKNNQGIIEDNSGSVIRWENQIGSNGDATQSNSSLGGEQRFDTYPGKVNVGFENNGSFFTLEGSSSYFTDNTFSVFYVGRVGDVGTLAALLGSFRVDNNNWSNCSGLRFVRKSNGDLAFQYGRPSYKQIVLNNLPEDEFFFFGFSLDSSGGYSYFDNSSSTIKTGTITGTILHNNDNCLINLARQAPGSFTYDHTEVAELMIFDDTFSTNDFEDMQNRLTNDYAALVDPTNLGSDMLVWLKNNDGIVEDNSGSVIKWENQIGNNGDATQSNSALGGEQRQETYPGKVNVGFVNGGSFLELEGSNNYFSDDSFSVFYVGKVGDVSSVASLFGNFRVDNNSWNTCSGLRFTRKGNGDLAFQYGRPAYKQIVLNNLPEDEFFFFGFSLDNSGNYTYFDNSSTILKTGVIDGTILHNSDNHIFNLANQANGSFTYSHTEIAELLVYGDEFSIADIEGVQNWLSAEYPELVKSDFMVDEVLPSGRTDLGVSEDIKISFTQNIDGSSSYPKVYVNKSSSQASGSWTLSSPNELTFNYSGNWPQGALVTVELDAALKSTGGISLDVATRSEYNFIVDTGVDFGLQKVTLSPMATVDFPQNGHQLPMNLVLPANRSQKVPVHIWVHGGGWSGGTAASSVASSSPHGDYLAKNLRVATLGISYRCQGSSGSFTLAMEDIDAAYQWAVANANTYNFDMTKVFFSGGSAGSPLAALAAQRYSSAIGLIGFNGMYNFVEDDNSFGQGNGYGQETPSANANSAFYQLRNNPPAAIFMHGDNDTTIPLSQSTLFTSEIISNGGDAETVVYPGEPHAFFNLGRQEYEDVLYEMANFIEDLINSGSNQRFNNENEVSELSTKNKELECYPIPANDILFVENVKGNHISIYDLSGNLVINLPNTGQKQLNISVLENGFYILKSKNSVKRILISHN